MKFGPQRGHITCIFDNFFKDFGLVLVAIVVSLISGDMDLLSENAGIPTKKILQVSKTRVIISLSKYVE